MRACIVGPRTPSGIWSLKWQRPFWKATIKIAPDLKSVVTAGLASHLTLISLHLRGLLLGVKSTSYLTSAKSKRMTDGRRPGLLMLCFPLFLIYGSQSLICVVLLSQSLSHTLRVPHHLFMSAVCMTGSFFSAGGATLAAGCHALDPGRQQRLVLRV